MNMVAVDDERLALESLLNVIKKVVTEADVVGFQNAGEALTYIQSHACDVAFLDIEMRDMSGIELAKQIKKIKPKVNIIFTTGYSEYTGEAFSLHASGYVLKPITPEKVKRELEDLRHPLPANSKKTLRVQAFGNFEVFCREEPIKFRYNKTKELLAYLVDRNGALCTNGELIGVLWEDDGEFKAKESYFKNLRTDLIKTLEDVGCGDVIIKQWGKLGIVPSKISCDYYDYLEGKAYAINAYRGEYMIQYSWSEFSYEQFE